MPRDLPYLVRMAPLRTVVALTLVGAALCVVPPATVRAGNTTPSQAVMHAPVRGQSPTPNRNLGRMPASAGVLAGEESLQPAEGDFLRVIAPGGAVVSGALDARESGDATLVSSPITGAARGWYLVHWNVTSGDGHAMGGDEGAWWSFGYRATTLSVKKMSSVNLAAVVPGGGTLSATINGLRTGIRTITVSRVSGTVYAARWTLKGVVDGATNPQFSWDVSTNKTKKTAALSGIVPRIGTYVVSVLVRTTTASGTSLTEYSTTVRVTA